MNDLKEFYEGKTILVTGGAGSIGSEIVRTLLKFDPKVVRVLDINETGLYELEHELNSEKLRLFVGDIRDKDRLKRAIEGVDIVFHAAALKHVPVCEYNPFEAVKTNVVGTQNLIDVAIDENTEKFITISTDKAVNPTNVLGATKLLAERLTISANLYKGSRKTAFSCVRFGNVIGSRGSVLPVFMDQIQKGGPITVTDPQMTRFVMSISRAVELVLKAAKISKGGEIFIFKMPALRIIDLAEVVVNEFAKICGINPNGIKIEIVGKRPGEKLHEELLAEIESDQAYEIDDMIVVVPFGNVPPNSKKLKVKKYTSKDAKLLTKDEVREFLNLYL